MTVISTYSLGYKIDNRRDNDAQINILVHLKNGLIGGGGPNILFDRGGSKICTKKGMID